MGCWMVVFWEVKRVMFGGGYYLVDGNLAYLCGRDEEGIQHMAEVGG